MSTKTITRQSLFFYPLTSNSPLKTFNDSGVGPSRGELTMWMLLTRWFSPSFLFCSAASPFFYHPGPRRDSRSVRYGFPIGSMFVAFRPVPLLFFRHSLMLCPLRSVRVLPRVELYSTRTLLRCGLDALLFQRSLSVLTFLFPFLKSVGWFYPQRWYRSFPPCILGPKFLEILSFSPFFFLFLFPHLFLFFLYYGLLGGQVQADTLRSAHLHRASQPPTLPSFPPVPPCSFPLSQKSHSTGKDYFFFTFLKSLPFNLLFFLSTLSLFFTWFFVLGEDCIRWGER